jgi:hypothetical protein
MNKKQNFIINYKEKGKGKTCNPQPIMRLTALFPPPPTPTTLILALSMESKEHETGLKRRRRGSVLLQVLNLGFSEIEFLRVNEEESEV